MPFNVQLNIHIHTCILILSKCICLPTDAQLNCLRNNFKIYIKIYIKTATTCFGVITIIRQRTIRSCYPNQRILIGYFNKLTFIKIE